MFVFSYLMGITSLYFFCQFVKTIDTMTSGLPESFEGFVYNYLWTLLIVYTLSREVVERSKPTFGYWLIAHLSCLLFALLGEHSWEFDSGLLQQLDIYGQVIFCCILLCCVITICKRSPRLDILFGVFTLYTFLLSLMLTATADVVYNVNYIIVSAVLSLFFCDWRSRADMLIHGLLTGCIVQGLNFYHVNIIAMFKMDNSIQAPSLAFVGVCYAVFLVAWLGFRVVVNSIKNRHVKHIYKPVPNQV